MTISISRSLRSVGAAILIAALPVAGLTPSMAQVPAMPGIPALGEEPYPLTQELIEAWVESYPAVLEASEALEEEFDVPEGEDPVAGMAALGMVAGAMDRLNGVVAPYGFSSYQQWLDVTFAVIYSYAMLQAPPEARAMMEGMFPTTPENIALVEANAELVGNVADNL